MSLEEIHRNINSIVLGLSGNEDPLEICEYLLRLKPLVEGEYDNTTRHQIFTEIWKFKLPQQILSLLKEKNFSSDAAVKSCHLCSIVVDCCVSYSLETQQVCEFVPDLTYTIQSLLSQMLLNYDKLEKSQQPALCGNISWIVMILGKIAENFISSSITMISSKHFMQFLMVEDSSIYLVALSYLQNLLKINKDIFFHVAESRAHGIVEELTFKLFGSAEDRVAKKTLSVLLFLLDIHPALLQTFTTKRYRGFKTYVAKLQGKGFDIEVRKMLSMLDAQSKRLLATQKDGHAAIIIQSCYRGYRWRRKLRKAVKGIVKFQRLYRLKKDTEKRELEKYKSIKERDMCLESNRRKTFLDSHMKQFKTMENIPAKTVNKFLEENGHYHATKIIAAWRGYQTRKTFKTVQPQMKREKAAISIQRQIRKWLNRCRSKHIHRLIELVPTGLTDERKCELDKIVGNIRNRFPVKLKDDAEFYDLHERAFRGLNKHVMTLHQTRRNDERRKALMAQLSVLSSQLTYCPRLDDVTLQHVEEYSSHSTPIMVAAKQRHLECLNEQKSPWWKKYEKEKPATDEFNELANEYFLNDEKQF